MEITITRCPASICFRATSFFSTASATPVCGQLNMPVRSASAAASASSCSLACSTMPSYFCSARIALRTDTGLPIWMAEASVGCAVIGSKLPAALIRQVQRIGRLRLRDDDARALLR